MDLKDKLSRLDKTLAVSARPRRKKPEAPDLSRLLPGDLCSGPGGDFWCRRTVLDGAHRHGCAALNDLPAQDPSLLRYVAKHAGLPETRLERLVFIDTETTGLSGGVGTLAFLVGMGYFEGGRFIVEQFFLRRFDEERAVLRQVAERLDTLAGSGGALVSFNGKAYDMPLIQSRAVMKRIRDFPAGLPHIDLLHASRRLWRKHLSDCALGTLESGVLDFHRRGDVPSHEIPGLYFGYLRSSDPRPLLPVFRHNQLDILSMVTLLTRMLGIFESAGQADGVPVDAMAVGRVYEDLKSYPEACAVYTARLNAKLSGAEKREVLLRLARLHKRRRDYGFAESLWQEAIGCRGFNVEPYEELAKACEHHIRDLPAAKSYTERALENIRALEQLYPGRSFAAQKESLSWRLQRLERKLKGARR